MTCNLFFSRSRYDFALWTGFVWGVLLWSLVGIFMVIIGLKISVQNYLFCYAFVFTLFLYFNFAQKKITKNYILILFVSTISFFVFLAIIFFVIKPHPVLSGDSTFFIVTAKKIAEDQSIINNISISHGPYMFFIQYISNVIDVLQIPYIIIALAISFSAGFAYITYVGIHKYISAKLSVFALSLLALVFMWSIPQMRYMACYVHTNFPVACYFFFFLTSLWFFNIEKDTGWLCIAAISLAACCSIRYDAFVVCFPFLIIAAVAMDKEQLKKARWIVLPALLFICLWALKLYSFELYGALLVNKSRLRPAYLSFYIGSLLFVFIFYFFLAKIERIQKLTAHIPLFSIYCTIFLGIILFSIKSTGMADQFLVLSNIMIFEGGVWWKSFWLWSIAFWVLLWWDEQEPASNIFTYGIPISICLLLFLSFPLLHFTFFQNISANRMLTKFIPVILFWVTIQSCCTQPKSYKEKIRTPNLSPIATVITIIASICLFFIIPSLRTINYVNQGKLNWAPKEVKLGSIRMFDGNPSTFFSFEPKTPIAITYDLKKMVKPACFKLSEETNYYFNRNHRNNIIIDYAIKVSKDKKTYITVCDPIRGINPSIKQIGRTTIIPYTEKDKFRYFKFVYRKSMNDTTQAITELSVLSRKPLIYSFL